jgi:hypothetical protein
MVAVHHAGKHVFDQGLSFEASQQVLWALAEKPVPATL